MTVVVFCSAAFLCEDRLSLLADLDNVFVVILGDLVNIDRCYIRQSIVNSDLTIVRILRHEI